MSRPIRALLVAHNGGLFGAERSLLSLAEGLAARSDFEPLVLVPHAGSLSRRCRAAGIKVRVGDYRQWVSSRRRLAGVLKRGLCNQRAWWRLAASLREFQPQVVYTGTGTTAFGARIARNLDIAHVWHLREFGERDYGLQYDLGRRRSLRQVARATALLANTQAVKRFFAGRLGRDDMQVVYNGFEFADTPTDLTGVQSYDTHVTQATPVRLSILGALVEGKGQHEALQALAELRARGFDLHLTLAGDGDPGYTRRLQDFVAEHDLHDAVTFAGFVDDPQRLYAESAATLICSRAEGFGRTAVESLNHGTPVIGTDAGGLPEILRHGQTGLLYDPGDWRALADRIRTLLTNAELYAHLCETGRREVRQRFAMPRYVQEIAAALAAAAQRHDSRVTPTEFAQESN